MRDLRDKLTVFLITCGESTTREAMTALAAQDVRFRLVAIKNKTPMSAAFQAMLERCKTPFYVQVDADMLLAPHAIGTMYDGMLAADEKVVIQAWPLWDRHLERTIFGVKIYRADVAKQFPYRDVLSCEVNQLRRMEEQGYVCDYHWGSPWQDHAGCLYRRDPNIMGDHAPEMTPVVAFERYSDLARKYLVTGRSDWLSAVPHQLLKGFAHGIDTVCLGADSGEKVVAAFWSMLGWAYGMGSPELAGEKRHGALPEGFAELQAQLAPPPAMLNVYVSESCNHRCWFCRNGRSDSLPTQDLYPDTLREALAAWPSVKEIYLAGFGEPLANPEIERLVDVATAVPAGNMGRRDVELITNGSLLAERGHKIAWHRLARVTVSMNAWSATTHKEATGQDTWDSVVDGLAFLRSECSYWGTSYVVMRSNVDYVEECIDHAVENGAHYVCLVNLLPHHELGNETAQAKFQREVMTEPWAEAHEYPARVEMWRTKARCAGVELRSVPGVLGGSGIPCASSLEAIGVDGNGRTGGCSRVRPPTHGMITEGSRSWADSELIALRVKRARGERDDICANCWACD
jgi:molybdenum cofactor biosynthesis enzyme MoaA